MLELVKCISLLGWSTIDLIIGDAVFFLYGYADF